MPQREYFGPGSLARLEQYLGDLNIQSIFLLHGRNSYRASGAAEKVVKIAAAYRVVEFSGCSENPNLETFQECLSLFKEKPCDCVVAIGGGSVIDFAKLTKYFCEFDGDLATAIQSNVGVSVIPQIPIIAIPTTAGSGSEATHFAVIYVGLTKYSIGSNLLLPDISIVDSTLTASVPPRRKASTGMDALSQAIESYWSIRSNSESQKFAKEAIQFILPNIRKAVMEATAESLEHMAYAAHLAGKAINITRTTAPHAVSYTLTSYFGVPHGHAVALTLGSFLAYNAAVTDADVVDPRGAEYVVETIRKLLRLLDCDNAGCGQAMLERLLREIGLETRLVELNAGGPNDIELILRNVNLERLQNNPRRVTEDALRCILVNISASSDYLSEC